ncbi:hypothetical protein HDU76_013911 [Blyttiomyces sp. JEL0837]|nr:hypothetical protein HDU76_013911 [Blyttiomyces sp. JEL0837]
MNPTATITPSKWDNLAPEIKRNIFLNTDKLTRCINGVSCDDDLTSRNLNNEIWKVAVSQDWPGDLSLLPKAGFPDHKTGLYLVRSRSMYARLNAIRPDLSIDDAEMKRRFKMIFIDGPCHGYYDISGELQVLIQEGLDIDKIPTSFNSNELPEWTNIQTAIKSTSSCLMHIAIAETVGSTCWSHLKAKLFTKSSATSVQLKFYLNAVKNGDLPILKFLHEHNIEFSFVGESAHMFNFALHDGRLDILEYMEESKMLNNFVAEIEAAHAQLHQQFAYIDIALASVELWEWYWLFQTKISTWLPCIVNPIVKDVESAQDTLYAAATFGTLESFNILFQHALTFMDNMDLGFNFFGINILELAQMDALAAMKKFIMLHPILERNSETVNFDNFLLKHSKGINAGCRPEQAMLMVHFGTLEQVKVYHEVCKCPNVDYYSAINRAASNGNLKVLRYFHRHKTSHFTKNTMDYAAKSGHLHVVQFLHQHRSEGSGLSALKNAAESGNLDLVKYLFKHTTNESTELAILAAAKTGNVDIFKFLCENAKRDDIDSTKIFETAAGEGHLAVVKFLICHYRMDSVSDLAINARNGRFNIIKYVNETTPTAPFTMEVMDVAAMNGHLRIVKYLSVNRTEGCSTKAFTEISRPRIIGGDISDTEVELKDVVKVPMLDYLITHYPDQFKDSGICDNSMDCDVNVKSYLVNHGQLKRVG